MHSVGVTVKLLVTVIEFYGILQCSAVQIFAGFVRPHVLTALNGCDEFSGVTFKGKMLFCIVIPSLEFEISVLKIAAANLFRIIGNKKPNISQFLCSFEKTQLL